MRYQKTQDRQFSELRNEINERKEYFTKETDYKKNQDGRLKSSINEMNAFEITEIANQITELTRPKIEMTQIEGRTKSFNH